MLIISRSILYLLLTVVFLLYQNNVYGKQYIEVVSDNSSSSEKLKSQSSAKSRLTTINPSQSNHNIIQLRGGRSQNQPLPSPNITAGGVKSTLYQPIIRASSEKWNVDASLIYAVIHVESYFNPTAQSPAYAYGLMQITEDGAAQEVAKRYRGGVSYSIQQIFDPTTNIDIGTAYLSILDTVYLRNIRDQSSRKLLVIAAYNCGLSNLMKYGFDTQSLSHLTFRVSQLTTEQLYVKLTKEFPIKETRNYVARVVEMQSRYLNR